MGQLSFVSISQCQIYLERCPSPVYDDILIEKTFPDTGGTRGEDICHQKLITTSASNHELKFNFQTWI